MEAIPELKEEVTRRVQEDVSQNQKKENGEMKEA